MFDTIGRNTDEEATKRSLASLLITTLMGGAVSSFLIGFGAMTVVRASEQVTPNEVDFTEYVPVDVPPQIAAPPPPPPAAAAPEPVPEDDTPPQPDELDDRIRDLEPVVPRVIRDQQRPVGEEGGTDGGEDGGKQGGVIGGDAEGTVGTSLHGGGIRLFHHSELETRSNPKPRYPRSAERRGFGTQACTVDVSIDEKGLPFEVSVRDCPDVFAEETRRAILRWRWYAPKVDRKKIKVRTTLRVVFRET